MMNFGEFNAAKNEYITHISSRLKSCQVQNYIDSSNVENIKNKISIMTVVLPANL